MLQTKASQKEKKDVFPFIRFVKKFLYSLGFNLSHHNQGHTKVTAVLISLPLS